MVSGHDKAAGRIDRITGAFGRTSLKRHGIYFGKYELLSRINIGGMAEIVKARDTSAGTRVVAIKRILPHLCADEHYRAMFMDESRLLAQLHHPSIAEVLEAGEIDGTPYIALEYVQGQDAREVFSACERGGQPLPLGLACYVIARVCEGLQYVHDRTDERGQSLGIVHRDVSLQNVLIGYDGEVKLTDFGIAVSAMNDVRTEAGIVKGKFGYMSPEQIRGAKLDRRSDVFATGICLYELLTSERLFSSESDYKAVERVRQADVPRPSSRNRQIPSTLEHVVLKALAKNPRDRYASANDLRRALQAFLSEANLFIERADLGAYLRAVFEEEHRASLRAEAAEQAELSTRSTPTAAESPSGEALFDDADNTWVAGGAPGPSPSGLQEIADGEQAPTDLDVFSDLPAPTGHSVVPEAQSADAPVPSAVTEPEPATGQLREAIPTSPSQLDMDWDEQEPTTIHQGFGAQVPFVGSAEAGLSRREQEQRDAGAPAAREHASGAPEAGAASPLHRQRSLPTLEIHRPREPSPVAMVLASAAAALAVFLVVYFWYGRAEAGIRIDTMPADAIVRIDGRRLPEAHSPFIATKLSSRQRHTIVVERRGHTSWSTTLKLPAGEIFRLPMVRLEPIAPAAPVEAEPAPVKAEPATAEPTQPSVPNPEAEQAAGDVRTGTDARAKRRASSAKSRASAARAPSPSPASSTEDEGLRSSRRHAAAVTPKAATATGTLRVNTRPWSQVSVDGVKAGNTPVLNLKVAAGIHTLTLENPEFGVKQKLKVTVRPGETVTRVLTLKPHK